MEKFVNKLLEDKTSRRGFLKSGLFVAGSLALSRVEVLHAQTGNPNNTPTIVSPDAPFVRPAVRQLSTEQRPVISPAFVPKPEVNFVRTTEPTDLDEIILIAAEEMGISEGYVRSIIKCESNFDPNAINPRSGARGLWQIMPLHADKFEAREWNYWTDWPNPWRNTMVAIEIKRKQGLSAWDCS